MRDWKQKLLVLLGGRCHKWGNVGTNNSRRQGKYRCWYFEEYSKMEMKDVMYFHGNSVR